MIKLGKGRYAAGDIYKELSWGKNMNGIYKIYKNLKEHNQGFFAYRNKSLKAKYTLPLRSFYEFFLTSYHEGDLEKFT